MRKQLTIGATFAGCLLAAYFLWMPNTVEVAEDNDHDHHDEFLTFSKELTETNGIKIEKALSGTLKQKVRAPAEITIISDQQAHIYPKVSGIAVAAYKNLGENVAVGEIVATLESKEIAEAKANYLTTLKKEQLALAEFEREKSLHDQSISSAQDFNNAENAKEEAQIERELSRQKLLALGFTSEAIEQIPNQSSDMLRIYELRSPINGKVIARHITPGELLTNEHEIYVIADLSAVWAKVHVFAQDRQFVKQGQTVTITANDGKSTRAKVSYLSPVIDPETRTSIALVTINNRSGTWLPGAFAQAAFITDRAEVPLVIKKEAIQNIDGVDVVFVAMTEGFAVRPITKGLSDEENCEVISGLQSGEDYACKNTFLLKADLKKDEAEHMD